MSHSEDVLTRCCLVKVGALLGVTVHFSMRPADHVVDRLSSRASVKIENDIHTIYKHTRALTRLNVMEEFFLYLEPMIPPKRFDAFPPLTGGC